MTNSRFFAPTFFALCCTFACDLSGTSVDIDVDSAGDTDAADDDGADDVAASESGDPDDHDPDCTTSGAADDGESGATTDPATDTPPELVITLPAEDATNDSGPQYDGFDDEMGLWYVDVMLAAEATDAEDGDLSMSIEWTTDQDGIQDAALGSGGEISVRLYSDDCFGTTHVITATVTDADGNSGEAMRVLNLWTLC